MQRKETPYSNLKIFHHGDILKKIENGERVAPLYIRIKPTNVCNQNCYYCHYKNPYLDLDEYNPKDFIPQEKMLEAIGDMAEIGVKAVTFSGGGEPLIYPYIEETMQMVINKGIDLSIITNGTLLEGEKAKLLAQAKWVRISLDAATEATYQAIRGVNQGMFTKLCANIAAFAKIKNSNCELGINFVVGKENCAEVYENAKLMKSLGVNHIKYSPQMSNDTESYHHDFKKEVIAQINRAKLDFEDQQFRIIDLYTSDMERMEELDLFARAYDKCYVQEFLCILAANSKIYTCQDKAYLSSGVISDITKSSFRTAWFSDAVTKKFADFSAQKICPHHCVHDDRNALLNKYFGIEKNHINFI